MSAPGTGVATEFVSDPDEVSWYRKPSFKKFAVIVTLLIIIVVVVIVLVVFLWKKQRAPDIILFIVDDLGWSDVSFHANGQIPTPNIDAMCSDAVLLNSHYVQPMCTPSRAALLTGKYPIKLGLQEYLFLPGKREALPTSHKLLPEYLKELGYSTHLVGKWHLGFYAEEFLPQNRGFDSFHGYYNGVVSYYNHTIADASGREGYDWRSNSEIDNSARGHYATDLITERAKEIIKSRDPTKPMLLILSHLAPHGGSTKVLYEVDEKWVKDPAIKHIMHENRTKLAGMIRALDDAFGQTVAALNEANMLSNSVILFSSDNGGTTTVDEVYPTGASNWPLRGQKYSPWEGGVRAASFIWSPLLKSKRYINKHIYHITDWLPTLYKLAGGEVEELPDDLDGHDIWQSISRNTESPRDHVLINYYTGEKESFAVRRGNFKLVQGTPPPKYNSWYATAGGTMDDYMTLQRAMKKSIAYGVLSKRPSFEKRRDDWREAGKVRCKVNKGMAYSPRGLEYREYTVDDMYNASVVKNVMVCRDTDKEPCLIDLLEDPCELRQYEGEDRKQIIEELTKIAQNYREIWRKLGSPVIAAWSDRSSPPDEEADPENFSGAWTPWVTHTRTSSAPPFST